MEYKVKDVKLAESGKLKIEWSESRMPVLMHLKDKYEGNKPLKGQRIAGCLHVTKETAVLVKTLVACGADVAWSGCNPLSTQDDIAAALAEENVPIFAWHGMSVDELIDFTPELRAKAEAFLNQYYKIMARTMLRYAIEKFPATKRQRYLKGAI